MIADGMTEGFPDCKPLIFQSWVDHRSSLGRSLKTEYQWSNPLIQSETCQKQICYCRTIWPFFCQEIFAAEFAPAIRSYLKKKDQGSWQGAKRRKSGAYM